MDRQLHAITSLAIKAGFHKEFIKPLAQPHSGEHRVNTNMYNSDFSRNPDR